MLIFLEYFLKVIIGSLFGVGMDVNVFIKIIGIRGIIVEYKLEGLGDVFERWK